MRYNEIIKEEAVPAISNQQAHDANMFGPMYHGTTNNLDDIIKQGFDISKSIPKGLHGLRPIGTSNGYTLESYGFTGIAAPVHHLGFAIYMTTVKSYAKMYSGGTMKGQKTFYLDSNNVDEINFGSPNTMMKWWRQHDYDMTSEETKNYDFQAWIRATMKLTLNLSRQYDAVHFLGKGIRKLLDGDQIAIYKPELIRVIDPKLASGLEIGSKVTHTQTIKDYHKQYGI